MHAYPAYVAYYQPLLIATAKTDSLLHTTFSISIMSYGYDVYIHSCCGCFAGYVRKTRRGQSDADRCAAVGDTGRRQLKSSIVVNASTIGAATSSVTFALRQSKYMDASSQSPKNSQQSTS